MDRSIQEAWRRYSSEPTDEHAGLLRAGLRRFGSPLGKRLVFDAHIAAGKARATQGDVYADIFSHSPRLQEARRNYRLRFPLAGAVYAGLSQEDLISVLESVGSVVIPTDIWNGGGYGLQSALDEWDGDDYYDYTLAWRYGNEPDEDYAEEVLAFGANWDGRDQAEVAITESTLRSEFIDDTTLLERIIEQYGGDGPTVEELQAIRGKGFAQLAWEVNRQGYGLQTVYTLNTRKEFKERFVLWIAMESKGWL